MAEFLIDAARDLAESSQLDDVFREDTDIPVIAALDYEGQPRERVLSAAQNRKGWPNNLVPGTNVIAEMIDELLDRLAQSLRTLPFEDSGGRYFVF